jgi:uncharacterized phage-like protein YoqJ
LLKRAQTNRNSPLKVIVINHHPGKDPELAEQEKYRYERFLGAVDFTESLSRNLLIILSR